MTDKRSTEIDDLYSAFETDANLEKKGVPCNYGRIVIDISRAGGSNQDYVNTFEQVFKDVKTALELGELPEEDARARFYTVYARSIIRRWRFRDADGTLVEGLGRKNGEIVPVTEAGMIEIMSKRHDLFVRIRKDAETMELFQNQAKEAIAKN